VSATQTDCCMMSVDGHFTEPHVTGATQISWRHHRACCWYSSKAAVFKLSKSAKALRTNLNFRGKPTL